MAEGRRNERASEQTELVTFRPPAWRRQGTAVGRRRQPDDGSGDDVARFRRQAMLFADPQPPFLPALSHIADRTA